jgi:hypothetical protein
MPLATAEDAGAAVADADWQHIDDPPRSATSWSINRPGATCKSGSAGAAT